MIEIKTLATGSKGNCYHISDGSTSLLLECGIKFKDIQKKLDFKTTDLAACLVTHEHKDHCIGLKDVLKNGIDTYMSLGTSEAIGITHHRIKRVRSKEQFRIGTWTILPFDVQHDVSEPVGFLFMNEQGEKLLFATDTYYIKYKFNDLSHIMLECNYAEDIVSENVAAGRLPKTLAKRLLRSHFSLENVKEFLRSNDLSKVEEIWLLHLSNANSDEARFKKEIAELTGKVVYVP